MLQKIYNYFSVIINYYIYFSVATASTKTIKPVETTSVDPDQREVQINPQPSTSCNKRRKIQQSSLTQFISRPISLTRQQKINNSILTMIYTDLQPFSIVTDKGFQNLLHELEPAYKLPSRNTFKISLLLQKYNTVSETIQNLLKPAISISLTTDTWTSIANQSYMAVTAHFISDDWKLYSCLLGCFVSEVSHTSENIAGELKNITEKWGITQKIISVTTDNAANIVNAIKISGWTHIPCFAHTINLVVKDSLIEIDGFRKKVKAIVDHFHRSTQANIKLFNSQRQTFPDREPLKLKNDVVTRWNSTFYMFHRIIELQEPLTATIALLHNPVQQLNEVEWESLKEACKILQPFEQITVEMSSEKAVTLSKVLNIISGLKSFLEKIKPTILKQESLKLLHHLQQSISKRFVAIETNLTLGKCSFMDPRFKTKAFTTTDHLKKIKEKIQEELQLEINKSRNENRQLSEQSSTPCESTPNDDDLVWQDFDSHQTQEIRDSPLAIAIIQMRTYTEDPILPRKENPLIWWQNRALLYPRLSVLARKYLCMIATSVPSERIFSKAGQVINERRNRLKGKIVEQLLFLNFNENL